MDFSWEKTLDYCLQHTTPPTPLLYELERETHLKTLAPQMMSGPLQGRLLQMISSLVQPNRILEIGTFTGYATLCLAAGLTPNGRLDTIEANPELEYLVRKYIKRSDYAQQIHLHIGKAEEILPQLTGTFDLVFMDAGKQDYARHYDLVIDRVQVGGILLADNVLWSGKVVQPETQHDRDTAVLHAFNQKIREDKRVQQLLLPIRDGLMIIRKIN